MTHKVLFIGVGKMGLPMAGHLHDAGHEVTVFDPVPQRMVLAAARGLHRAAALPAALATHRWVISSLPDDTALLAVADHIAQQAAPGTVWLDTSTVSPAASQRAAALCQAASIRCLRTPVSGNSTMAEQAQLTVYASGDPAAFEAAAPLLACWGPRRLYLGDGEQARVAKLAVNLLIVGTSTMLAEALALGERGGLDWQQLWQVIEGSAAASPIVLAKAPALREHDYTATFTVQQMQKDVALIQAAAQALGVATPVADVAAAALQRASAAGEIDDDYAVVIRDARASSSPPAVQPPERIS